MSTESNKTTARRWFDDIIVAGQLSVADEIFSARHRIHDPHAPPGGWPVGPEGPKAVARVFGGSFSGWQVSIDAQIAEGDRVATCWTARATHTGALQGLPPTGRTAQVTGVNVTRFADGRIVESWYNFDMLGLLQQLGAVPAPPHG
jgi:predicted SnoaL-like aldol condensation-catalyzing enzyme